MEGERLPRVQPTTALMVADGRTTLLPRLSNDLLERVCVVGGLDVRDVIRLAQSCRGLAFLSSPPFLARLRGVNGSGRSFLVDLVRGFRRNAYSLQTTKRHKQCQAKVVQLVASALFWLHGEDNVRRHWPDVDYYLALHLSGSHLLVRSLELVGPQRPVLACTWTAAYVEAMLRNTDAFTAWCELVVARRNDASSHQHSFLECRHTEHASRNDDGHNGGCDDGAALAHLALGCQRQQLILQLFQLTAESRPDLLNARDAQGNTPLILTYTCGAFSSNTPIVKLLLSFPGTDVNARNFRGETALHWACLNGPSSEVEHLLKLRPDVDVNARDDVHKNTALIVACSRCDQNVARVLLERRPDVDVNARDVEGNTALMWACRHTMLDVVGRLLEWPGVDVSARNAHGDTVLTLACRYNRIDVAVRVSRHNAVQDSQRSWQGIR